MGIHSESIKKSLKLLYLSLYLKKDTALCPKYWTLDILDAFNDTINHDVI